MRINVTVAAVTAVLAVTLVGCGGSGDKADTTKAGTKAGASAAPSAADDGGAADGSDASDDSSAEAAAGIPPEPTGDTRAAVLAAVFDVSPRSASDEDKAIDAARNQCAALDSGAANPDHAAAQRFSYNGVKLTDDQGTHIDYGLRKSLCPKS
jgi:hypothetical protein